MPTTHATTEQPRNPSPSTAGNSAVPHRGVALAAGLAYLVTIVTSIPAQFLSYAPVLGDPGYVLGAGADMRVQWGALLELVTAVACIATAVILFPLLRRHHQGAALGFVTVRVLEAALIVTGIVAMLSVVTLRQPAAEGAEATARVVAAEALIAIHDWTFLLGPGVMPGLNALLLGYLVYRTRLVPRLIPAIGLLAAPLFLTSAAATLVGLNEPASVWTALATLPIFAWELSLGIWLIVKGFTPTSVARLVPHAADPGRGTPHVPSRPADIRREPPQQLRHRPRPTSQPGADMSITNTHLTRAAAFVAATAGAIFIAVQIGHAASDTLTTETDP